MRMASDHGTTNRMPTCIRVYLISVALLALLSLLIIGRDGGISKRSGKKSNRPTTTRRPWAVKLQESTDTAPTPSSTEAVLPRVHFYVKASCNSSSYYERAKHAAETWTKDAAEGSVTFLFDDNNGGFDELSNAHPGLEMINVDRINDRHGEYSTPEGSSSEVTKALRLRRKTRAVFADFTRKRKYRARQGSPYLSDTDFICYLDDDMSANVSNLRRDLASNMPSCSPFCIVGEIFGNAEAEPWARWTVGGWCMQQHLLLQVAKLLARNTDEDLVWTGSDDVGFNEVLQRRSNLHLNYVNSDRWYSELSYAVPGADGQVLKKSFFTERVEKNINIATFALAQVQWRKAIKKKAIDPAFIRGLIENSAVYHVEWEKLLA